MTHLSDTQLHEIHYGFTPATAHLDECESCRKTLEGIRNEGNALRQILRDEATLASPGFGRRVSFARSIAGIAAAAGFLAILVFVLYGSKPLVTPAAEDDPEKVFRKIEAMITNATTLKIRFRQESESGELYLKGGNRVKFISRRPVSPEGGVDEECVTISDGRNAVNQVRDFGFVSIEGKVAVLPDLKARIAKGFARGGIRFVSNVLPGAAEVREASHWLWMPGDPSDFKAEAADGEAKVLSYRLSGETEGGRFRLTYEPKTLRPLKLMVRNNLRDTTLESYEEFVVDGAIADDEFRFPPGQEEEGPHGTLLPFAEYLELVKTRRVREVWFEYGELVAHLTEPIRRGTRPVRQVWVHIPAESLKTDADLARLSEGVRPDRVHVGKKFRR